MAPPNTAISTSEAAEMLSQPRYPGEPWGPVTSTRVYLLIKAGRLPARRSGNTWILHRYEVNAFHATWKRRAGWVRGVKRDGPRGVARSSTI